MIDERSVLTHLTELHDALRDLERYRERVTLEEFKANRDTRNMVLYALVVSIQSCIDIANHIISEFRLPRPETYKESFETLWRHGYLEEGIYQKLADLAGFRNVLVHVYWGLDLERAYSILQDDIWIAEKFERIVKGLLEKHES